MFGTTQMVNKQSLSNLWSMQIDVLYSYGNKKSSIYHSLLLSLPGVRTQESNLIPVTIGLTNWPGGQPVLPLLSPPNSTTFYGGGWTNCPRGRKGTKELIRKKRDYRFDDNYTSFFLLSFFPLSFLFFSNQAVVEKCRRSVGDFEIRGREGGKKSDLMKRHFPRFLKRWER